MINAVEVRNSVKSSCSTKRFNSISESHRLEKKGSSYKIILMLGVLEFSCK